MNMRGISRFDYAHLGEELLLGTASPFQGAVIEDQDDCREL